MIKLPKAASTIAEVIGFLVLVAFSSFVAGVGFEAGVRQHDHQPHIIIVKAEDVGIQT